MWFIRYETFKAMQGDPVHSLEQHIIVSHDWQLCSQGVCAAHCPKLPPVCL